MHLYAHASLAAPLIQSLVARRSPEPNFNAHEPGVGRALLPGKDPDRPLDDTRLLSVVDSTLTDGHVGDLADHLKPGDLLVLNDAGTLPASLAATAKGRRIEVRLAAAADASSADFPATYWAVLMGEGSWKEDTDERVPPPALAVHDLVLVAGGLSAVVEEVSAISPRLVRLRFDREGDTLAEAIYRVGMMVQYRHLDAALTRGAVQTPFAVRPWAMEMPSTGRPLSWALLDKLQSQGIGHVFLTHAAGLSATGDPALDAALPLPERYWIPDATIAAIKCAKAAGSRVIAVGTTVVRALEAAARNGFSQGHALATLRLAPGSERKCVDGILTGIHAPGESHFDLLGAFADEATLHRAHAHAADHGYLAHELGDLMFVLTASTEGR